MEPTAQPPLEQEQAQPQAQQLSPQDRLQALNAELDQARASIEQNLAKELAQLATDTELEDLFYEDKEAFFNKILQIQNEKILSQLQPLVDERNALGQEVEAQNKMEAIEQARQKFEAENPQVDTQALLQGFTQLPQEAQAQIESLPPEQIFPALQQLLGISGGSASGAELPQQVTGVPSNASVMEPDMDLPTRRL